MNTREVFEAEYSKGDFGLSGCDLSKHEDGSYVNDSTFSAFFWFGKGLAAQAEQEIKWRPIETAPKNGRELILLLPASKFPQIAYSNSWWACGFSHENKPTHWMPLPPTPDGDLK